MNLQFDEKKTTQAAAYLIKLRGGNMSYLKLLKLLYLVDREALSRWGRPVTFDHYFSMQHGQVLSHTLDLINEGVPPEQTDKSYWASHISAPNINRDVQLLAKELSVSELSRAEVSLIDEIFEKYGKMTRWQLRDFHHELPEYVDPCGSRVRTEYEDILRVVGKTDAQICAILNELKHLEAAEALFKK